MDKMLEYIKNSPTLDENSTDNTGEPLFKPHHVWATSNSFGQLVRMIFCEEGITVRMFRTAIMKTYLKHGRPQRIATSQQSNLFKAITRKRPTFYKFKEIICDILGYDMDITITLTKNGKTKSYNYKKLLKKYMKMKHADKHKDGGNA